MFPVASLFRMFWAFLLGVRLYGTLAIKRVGKGVEFCVHFSFPGIL
jgi:hypothetical protein